NLYQIPQQAELGRLLVDLTGISDGRVFFCNSGAEASEAAIKLARKSARQVRGRDVFEIIVASHGFHGRTMGALSATMVSKYHEGFQPLVPGFIRSEERRVGKECRSGWEADDEIQSERWRKDGVIRRANGRRDD